MLSRLISSLDGIDRKLTGYIQRLELGPLEILIVPGCTLFGWSGMSYIVLPSVSLLTCQYSDRGAPQDVGALWYFMLSAALGQTVCRFAKQTFQRKRPSPPSPEPSRFFHLQKKIGIESGDGPSFPSGDSLGAGVTAGVLSVAFSNKLFLLVALWASIGRQYWWFHYFFDTIVGGAIGIASAYLIDAYFGGFRNVQAMHALVVFPIFIVIQKALKRYGALLRAKTK